MDIKLLLKTYIFYVQLFKTFYLFDFLFMQLFRKRCFLKSFEKKIRQTEGQNEFSRKTKKIIIFLQKIRNLIWINSC